MPLMRAYFDRSSALPLLAGALLITVAACGARGSLPGAGGGPGAGGAPGGGGGPGVGPGVGGGPGVGPGGGGGGGSPPTGFCPALVEVEPAIELPALSPADEARAPLLLRLPEGRVAVLAGYTPIESPGVMPATITAVTLAPWGSWPPAPGPHGVLDGAADLVPFVAKREPQAGAIALGLQRWPMSAPPGCNLAAHYGVSPDAPPGPAALQVLLNGSCNDRPVGVATAGNGLHFTATDADLLPGIRGLVAVVLDASGNTVNLPPPRCASTPLVGDVLPRDQRFLFAHASGDPDECFVAPSQPPPGPARRLLLRRIGPNEDTEEVVYTGFDDLVAVHLLPRADGAWLVHRESGASAEQQPPALAMRLGPGNAVGAPFEVTAAGTDRFAAASLGDGLVTAFTDSLDPSASTVVLRVFSPEGEASGEASFSTNGAWLAWDRMAVLGGRDPGTGAGSVLVAWVGAGNGSDPRRVWLRRFDCVGGL